MGSNKVKFNVMPLANQFVLLQLEMPQLAQKAQPGHFVAIENRYRCYIMGQQNDKVEIILPPFIAGIALNKTIEVSSLRGQPLEKPLPNTFNLFFIENDALSAVIFYLKKYRHQFKGLILIGTSDRFPFIPCPSRQMIFGMPPQVIASIPLLEDWHIPHRLASLQDMPGCFQGTLETLSREWLKSNQNLTPILNQRVPPLL